MKCHIKLSDIEQKRILHLIETKDIIPYKSCYIAALEKIESYYIIEGRHYFVVEKVVISFAGDRVVTEVFGYEQ